MQTVTRILARLKLAPCLMAVVTLCLAPAAVAGEDVDDGRIKVEQVCANCHGLYGEAASGGNSALSPKLTAQNREYLVSRLLDYRSGKREHAQMTFVAQMISEQDIDNVAAWYAGLQIYLSGNLDIADEALEQSERAGKARAEQLCQHCHGLDGQAVVSSSSSPVPDLSGQPRPYIVERLKAYRSGKIEHPQMTPIAKSLTDADIANVADWYSGIRVEVLDFD